MHLPGLPSHAGMGVELLVAGLWAGVLAYWIWTRRPAADTVGIFHEKLQVLERATPMRVAPANRLAGPSAAVAQLAETALPRQVAVAAAVNKRSELRRRRRDVLVMLAGTSGITLLAAVFSGSSVALAFQVSSDLALGAYVYMLSSAGKARVAPAYAARSATYRRPDGPSYRVPSPRRASAAWQSPGRARMPERAAAYPVIYADLEGRVPVGAGASRGAYGDFDSYASLA